LKKSVFTIISGDSTFGLRQKIVNTIFFVIALFLLVTSVTNLFIEEVNIIVILTFFASFFFFFFFYLARVKRIYDTAHIVTLFVIGLLFFYHKYDGGIGCGTGFYIIVETIGIVAIFEGRAKMFYLGLLAIISFILLFFEIYSPGYVIEISRKTCFVNNALAFVLSSVSAGFLIQVYITTYKNHAILKEKESLTDPLTGLLNRRAFLFELKNRIPLFRRKNIPFSLIMLDFDDFKYVNDRYGHRCGDVVLFEVGKRIKSILKQGDILSRWGGEEFLIFLPYSNIKNSCVIAERLRLEVEGMDIHFDNLKVPMTITLGVREFDLNNSIEENIEMVDLAMYRGKRAGKNRVVSD